MDATTCSGVNAYYCDMVKMCALNDGPTIHEKAIESSVTVSLSSAAVGLLNGELPIEALTVLPAAQYGSSTFRQHINKATENPVVRCIGHTAVQAGRNAIRGADPIVGGIDGLGYCVTSEIAEGLESYPKAALFTKIAGAYATEMSEAWAGCQLIQKRGGKIPALGGALRFMGNLCVNGFVCGGLVLKGAITATFVSGEIIAKA